VAAKAIKTVIYIVGYIPVFTVHISAVMFMTVYAAKDCEIRGSSMAIPTCIPFISMSAGIDRKMESVMIKG